MWSHRSVLITVIARKIMFICQTLPNFFLIRLPVTFTCSMNFICKWKACVVLTFQPLKNGCTETLQEMMASNSEASFQDLCSRTSQRIRVKETTLSKLKQFCQNPICFSCFEIYLFTLIQIIYIISYSKGFLDYQSNTGGNSRLVIPLWVWFACRKSQS